MSDLVDPEHIRELVRKIQARIDYDESCSEIYNLYNKSVIGMFRRFGFSMEEALDLTQDTFQRVFKSIDSFRSDAPFGSWLFEVAGNVYRNEIRRRRAEKRDAQEIPIESPPQDENGGNVRIDLAADNPSALEDLIHQERQDAVRKALAGLPPQMRKCCELRYIRGLKYQEIADLMNLSIETVKAHLHQGRKRIEAAVGKEGKPS
ncbi:MAG: RNA polymerase sigma factor [Thermoanaerobaculia bacterium]